jgi:hypothetical protein
VWIGRGQNDLSDLRQDGRSDVMARPAWHYFDAGSYTLNSYGKPALSLQTLEGLVGDETMTRIMRTYARRYMFRHPTSADFIAVVSEVTGRDYRWFFDQTWFSSDLCDYAVTVRNRARRAPEGFVEGPDGRLVLTERPRDRNDSEEPPEEAEVIVRRLGDVRLPVEVRVDFADGRCVMEQWDGRDRWTRLRYPGARVTRAVVDPEGRIALDVNPANNAWVDEKGTARRAASKWGLRYLLWLQHLLELHTVAM